MTEYSLNETVTVSSLQKQLAEFASAQTQARELMFPGLIAFIKQNVTHDVIVQLVNKDAQQQLQAAIQKTIATPIEINGQEINPWKGSRSLVVLTMSGGVLATESIRPDDMKPYGNDNYNFYPPALIKALAALHLHKAKITGGISDNWNYLRKIGFPYHAGSTIEPEIFLNEEILIGASGCEATSEFLSLVLDDAIPTHFTQAGAMDEAFAGITAVYLSDMNLDTRTIQPPPTINRLLAGN